MEENVKRPEKEVSGIKWIQPGRTGVFLVLLYLFSWYLFNDMFNLISIEGLNSIGNFFNGINIPAYIPLFLSFMVMISVWLTLVIRSTFDTSSHRPLNIFVGIWTLFGSFLMVVSLVLMLQGSGPSFQIPWFFGLTRNGIYHLGVFLFQIPGIIYFALFR